ncbi:MAG: hypothetical protein HOB26_02430 [Flavobacteriales bacterium]|jgi:hypothetical protein|nr:hypothetical protein [Flavobacteriales bacterium]
MKYILLSIICSISALGFSQSNNFQVRGFGHLEYESVIEEDSLFSNFKLGEQELFVNGKFNNYFSYLSEITLNYSSHGNYKLNIERLRIKYNYYKNHSFIIGKFHTPVNYWNDVYFHARLFFPTIDRPLMFSKWIPVHTFGVRLQGQNLGKRNFGYDLLIGNGMASEDLYNVFEESSITAAVHWKPIDEIRFGFSYYTTSMKNASSMAAHSHGHNDAHSGVYSGPLDFQMLNASVAYFGEKWELLNEFSYNRTETDTLGVANNFSNYLYFGYRIKEKNVPFIAYDILSTADNDLHTFPYNRMKFVLGYKHEYSTKINVKGQIEYYRNIHDNHDHHSIDSIWEFIIQLSYAIY